MFSRIYTPLHVNKHPQIVLGTFQLGHYLPNDLECPILLLQTIIPLICSYIFSRKHSWSLEIQKTSFKKTQSKTMVQRLVQLLCLNWKNVMHTSRVLIYLCSKRNGVSSLFPSKPGKCSPRLPKPPWQLLKSPHSSDKIS